MSTNKPSIGIVAFVIASWILIKLCEIFIFLHLKSSIKTNDLINVYLFIYNIRRIARLFPTVHYALNLRNAARNEFERNMEIRYDFRCRRKPKCAEKTCVGKYGSRTKFTYDSDPTGNRIRAALVKGMGTTTAPTRPPSLNVLNVAENLLHQS